MGRPPIGKRAMTGAERVRRYRLKRARKGRRRDYARQERDDARNPRITSFLHRADLAERYAFFSGAVTNSVREAVHRTAAAWEKLDRQLSGDMTPLPNSTRHGL
jgi:hypothetical protein